MSNSDTRMWAIPGFGLFLAARLVSWAGSAASLVAMPVTMFQLTGSILWTSATAAAEALPYLCLGLFAGVIGDRFPSLPLMVACDLLSGLSMITVPLAYLAGHLTAVHVLLAAAVSQSAFVFFDAASLGLLPALVGRSRILKANGLLMSAGGAIEGGVPALAGLALTVVSAPWLVFADAASFVVSAALLARANRLVQVPRRSVPVASLGAEIGEATRFLIRNHIVRTTTTISALLTVVSGGVVGLIVVWAKDSFAVVAGDVRLGLMFAVLSLATVLGGALATAAGDHASGFTVLRVLAPAAAAFAYGTTAASSWWIAMILLTLTFTCIYAAVTTAVSMRQRAIPAHLQSRVNVLGRMLAYGGGFSAGALGAGWLTERITVVPALRTVFVALILASLVSWLATGNADEPA